LRLKKGLGAKYDETTTRHLYASKSSFPLMMLTHCSSKKDGADRGFHG
jgi:hypothetical protein